MIQITFLSFPPFLTPKPLMPSSHFHPNFGILFSLSSVTFSGQVWECWFLLRCTPALHLFGSFSPIFQLSPACSSQPAWLHTALCFDTSVSCRCSRCSAWTATSSVIQLLGKFAKQLFITSASFVWYMLVELAALVGGPQTNSGGVWAGNFYCSFPKVYKMPRWE